MYRLTFLTGKLKGRRLAVQQGNLLIGRGAECQLDLVDDDEVSRSHAVIEQRADGVYIRDLGSMNPTEINGRAVKEWKLGEGDKIEIGRTVMQFQVIQTDSPGMRRRSSPLQYLAYATIGLLIMAQMAYLFIFPLWQKRTAPASFVATPKRQKQEIAKEPVPPDSSSTSVSTIEAELDEAIAQAAKENAAHTAMLAGVTSGGTSGEVQNEVAELRKDLVDLRKQVEDIATVTSASPAAAEAVAVKVSPAETAAVAVAEAPLPKAEVATNPPPAVVQAAKEDALLSRAREMLTEALVEEQKHNLVKADNLMERIQVMAPDFVPAYVERARLYESRGMLKKSGEQWFQVMNRTAGSPLYDQAAAERQRLARTEIIMTMTRDTPGSAESPPATRLPRRIRISSIERDRFDASKDYDEMRIVRVALKAKVSEGDIDTDDFSAVVTFYDRGLKTNKVLPSHAVVPEKPVTVEGIWRAGEQKAVTAAYIVSKGFRVDEEEETGERHAYEGVRIQIYYKDQLQDEEAVPKSLLALDSPPPPYDDPNAPVGK